MEKIHEETFKLNGLDSWIHCIYIEAKARGKKTADETIRYHYHNYVEFLYSLESDAIVYINGEKYSFKDGDLIIINSNDLHDLAFPGDSRYICVKFSPNILYADEQAFAEYKYAVPFLNDIPHQIIFDRTETEHSGIKDLCLEIMDEWNKKDYAFELAIRADILKIFTQILRYWKERGALSVDKNLPESIKKALVYITENYETVTERDAAGISGLSYNHFSNTFKSAMGQSFKSYLISVRIKAAERLLISTDKSMTEIAMETGFTTSSHFIANFKRYKGVTPKKFRINLGKFR